MPLRVMFMAGSMEGGGSERQTLRLIERFDRARVSPELYLTYRRGTLLAEVPSDLPLHAASDQPFMPRLYWPGRIHAHLVRSFEKLLIERRIDVVYDRTFHMTQVAAPACHRAGVPRVSTIVSPPSLDLPGTEHRFLNLKRMQLSRAYHKAAKVFAVSEAVRWDAIDYYKLPETKVEVLHSGVDVDRIHREREWPGEFAISPMELEDKAYFHIACVGRLREEKGQRFLLESLHCLNREYPEVMRGLIVWMVGDGPDRNSLETMVNEFGLQRNVRFTGHLSSAVPVISRCRLLISPSRYEGWANAILEAFACGVPVIATRVGGSEEMVVDQQFGRLVRYGDAEELGNAIRAMRFQEGLAALYAAQARQHLLQHWQVDRVVDRLTTTFEEVAHRNLGPAQG